MGFRALRSADDPRFAMEMIQLTHGLMIAPSERSKWPKDGLVDVKLRPVRAGISHSCEN